MKSFSEFWPYYLGEHQNSINRRLHFVGTSLVIAICVYALLSREWGFLFLAPFAGYGFAWLGHFVFEKNRPATFKYPLWSLRADFKMYFQMLRKFILNLTGRHLPR